MTVTSFADDKVVYQAALASLFSGKPEDTESDLSRLFTPTFTQRDDDTTRDFPAFVAHIRWLREILPTGSVTLTVTQFLRDGAQLAERHDSTTTFPDGSVGRAETFQFAQLAEDGRIEWIVETVRHVQ
ncbi:hypothetical protein QBC46DRAFT_21228 [Diplogelasinospora grovesii]|uniref:SnoaL-like domain-containing protein n=1 Tax=Diplogelasinospora grovesii TaxID=303347 RepID=A0AAN6S1T5_9PEZI|nr:hypothetical protein QBC46DRAFT_21228 [Diplogelasinospora grovesii]